MRKWICVFLCIFLLTSLLSGCSLSDNNAKNEEPSKPKKKPDPDTPILTYALDQDMIDWVYECIEESETLAVEEEDLEATEEKLEELDDAYYAIVDQYHIAYILYCMDQDDSELEENYLYSVDVLSDMESAYNEMCKRIYLSDTPIRDELFADWTQQEIDLLLLYDDEIADLEKRNSEILVEYRGLDDEDMFYDMVPLYNEQIRNNNRIAQIYGYDNYYEYAHENVYLRDYEISDIARMREYAAKYLLDAYYDILYELYDLYAELDSDDIEFVDELLMEDYDDLDEDYLEQYLEDMPKSVRKIMEGMFDEERVSFGKGSDAYQGAFTTWIGGRPYCYFGPGYCGNETMVHELGHYYGISFSENYSQPIDLSETQSQGNEWLFILYLESVLSEEMYDFIVEYRMLDNLTYIIMFLMVDEFEQIVYAHEDAGELTYSEYCDIMDQVAEQYGGMDTVSETIGDVQSYWPYVVLESPVYYISYATSALASIDLFLIGEEDPDEAWDIFITLNEEQLTEEGFLANIDQAGLRGPFDRSVYEAISERYS